MWNGIGWGWGGRVGKDGTWEEGMVRGLYSLEFRRSDFTETYTVILELQMRHADLVFSPVGDEEADVAVSKLGVK